MTSCWSTCSGRPSTSRRSGGELGLEALPLSGAYFSDRSQDIGMAEVMVAADSELVGKTVVDARLRTRFGLTAIGLRHGRVAHEGSLLGETLRIGDTLLVVGRWKDIERLRADGGDLLILNLPAELAEVLPVTGQGTAGALLPRAHGRPDGERHRPERAGRADRLPHDGPAGLHRPRQRVSLDPLEEPDPDRRHAAVLDRAPEYRRGRAGGRRPDGPDRRRGDLRGAGEPVRHHRGARALHLEHGDRRADGPGRARHRGRAVGVAVSVRDDRRARPRRRPS